jgi:hypothetical protein
LLDYSGQRLAAEHVVGYVKMSSSYHLERSCMAWRHPGLMLLLCAKRPANQPQQAFQEAYPFSFRSKACPPDKMSASLEGAKGVETNCLLPKPQDGG